MCATMSWSPATAPLPRVPRWRPAWPPIMPTSTRCGEERNRPTRASVKTGSPASTSRTWSRPDPQPDELSASSRHARHPLVARAAVRNAPSGTRACLSREASCTRWTCAVPFAKPQSCPAHGGCAGNRGSLGPTRCRRPRAAGVRYLASWAVRRGRSSNPFVWSLRFLPLGRALVVESARSSVLQPPCRPRHTLADAPAGRWRRLARTAPPLGHCGCDRGSPSSRGRIQIPIAGCRARPPGCPACAGG